GGAGILAEDFDGQLDIFGAGDVAGFKLFDEGDLHAADEPDLSGPGLQRGGGADQEGSLLLLEEQADHVGLIPDKPVDDRELDVREILGHTGDAVGEEEPDPEDQIVLLPGQQPQELLPVLPTGGGFEVTAL